MYKGIFWYDPTEYRLICKKVACDGNGTALEETIYSSKSGDNFNHKAEWKKLPKVETGGRPYNYYPRGRVEIKNNKVTIYLTPVLNTDCVLSLILSQFGLYDIDIPIKIVPDGSEHYKYLMDYTPRICNVCGNVFDFWDEQEDFSFQRHIGYGSCYDCSCIDICLCCECFDRVLDWLLPQCKIDPLSDYDVYVPKEVFVGGSKSIDTLTDEEKAVLQRYMDNKYRILVGDCRGADRAIQEFLSSAGYSFVTVYATGENVRNNVGNWHCCMIPTRRKDRDFEYYRIKDCAMIKNASEILMLWDGKSRGTFANICDALDADKPVTVSTRTHGIISIATKEVLEEIREYDETKA